ncbi:Vitamin K-dependent protein C (Fragment) [Seminavis robusta]|uniref:Vitamin K-dependent protein C n=1 Tax=Seminavis robusta TaxID=568900 RepID=A0A9N8HXL8_9STRA
MTFLLTSQMSRIILLLILLMEITSAGGKSNVRKAQQEEAFDNVEDQGPVAPEQGIRGGFPVQRPIPWFVSFVGDVVCGGVLIHEDMVLTTAHCVDGFQYPERVRIGSLFRNRGGEVRRVRQGRTHPRWNGIIEEGYDIALLKLNSPVNSSYTPATVNSFGNVPRRLERLFTVGHGQQETGGAPPDRLQGLLYTYVEDCEPRLPAGVYNPTWFLCANANPSRGTCPGDSGGPVVVNGTNILVGVNSFSPGDCNRQQVDVYSRVSTYYDWIIAEVCTLAATPPTTGCPPGCLFAPPQLFTQGFQAMRSFFGLEQP